MYRTTQLSKRGARRPGVLLKYRHPTGSRTFSKSLALRNEATSSTTPPPKKKRGFFRRLGLYSTGLVVLFYTTGPVVAFNNERFNAFFGESVPFGQTILDVAEEQGLDEALRLSFISSGQKKLQEVFKSVSQSAASGPPAAEKTEQVKDAVVDKAKAVKDAASGAAEKAKAAASSEKVTSVKASASEKLEKAKEKAKERAKESAQTLKTKVEKSASKGAKVVKEAITPSEKSPAATRPAAFSAGVEDLVRRAEAALAGKPIDTLPEATTTPEQPAGSPPDITPVSTDTKETSPALEDKNVYAVQLPIGFEPPPGYKRPKPTPAPSTPKDQTQSETLPLVAPAVADISASEPVIAELASTIDALAAFLKENPKAASSARGILDTAKDDLRGLSARIQQASLEERQKLEAQMDEQAREYTLKLLELEMSSQDKLDEQELEFKHFFEEERRKMVQAYREKLENELATQSEIINERLKAEVIAQGIEMQRRWIREIKLKVEEERGGRLGKLEELSAELKQLRSIALGNAEYLDENLRLHATWASLRALTAASVDAPVRRPFRDELRILRHASGAKEDELTATVLDSLEKTDVPDVGVEPLADLTMWFTTSVAPQVAKVALVPEHDAGVLSYIASHFLSSFRFARRGLVEGDDVLSVLARAEYYMNEKDLDSATRELNQINGAAKVLLHDWLEAARRRLEVLQALQVIEAQTKLASLQVVS